MPKEIILGNSRDNNFLSPEEQIKNRLAYYGEFLLIKDFDDGWREEMSEKFKNFCEKYSQEFKDIIDFEVTEIQESYHNQILVILSLDKRSKTSEQDILKLSLELQEKFLFHPIVQKLGHSFYTGEEKTMLPVELLTPNNEDLRYNRHILQKKYAEIKRTEDEIKKNKHSLKVLSQSTLNVVNEVNITGISQLIGNYESMLEELYIQIQKIINDLYIKRSIQPFGTEVKNIISSSQAHAVLDTKVSEKESDFSSLITTVETLEALVQTIGINSANDKKDIELSMHKFLNEINKSQLLNNRKNKEFVSGFFKKIEKIIPKVAGEAIELLSISPIEKCIYNEDQIIEVFTQGRKESYKHNGTFFENLELDGIGEVTSIHLPKIIDEIKENHYLVDNFIASSDDLLSYFYLVRGEYKALTIEGENQFKDIEMDVEDGGNIPVSGTVSFKNDSKSEFIVQEDGSYEYISYNGQKKFKKLNISGATFQNQEGETIEGRHGDFILENGEESYFYTKNGKDVFLKVDSQTTFKNLKRIHIKESYKQPFAGTFENKIGTQSMFYITTGGSYELLSINKETCFSSLQISNNFSKDGSINGRYISCISEQENGNKSYFYNDEKAGFDFQFLIYKGDIEFQKIIGIDTEYDFIQKGFIKTLSSQYVYFDISVSPSIFNELDIDTDIISIDADRLKHNGCILQLANGKDKYYYFTEGIITLVNIEGTDTFERFDAYQDAVWKQNEQTFKTEKLTNLKKIKKEKHPSLPYFSNFTFHTQFHGEVSFAEAVVETGDKNNKYNHVYLYKNREGEFTYFRLNNKIVYYKYIVNFKKAINGHPIEGCIEISPDKDFIYFSLNRETQEYDTISFNNMDIQQEKGKVLTKNNGRKIYVYTIEAQTPFILEINGTTEFYDISIKDTNQYGIPLCGTIISKDGGTQYFYLYNDRYIFLNIEGTTKFESIYDVTINSSGTPLNGNIINIDTGLHSYFYIWDGKYSQKSTPGKMPTVKDKADILLEYYFLNIGGNTSFITPVEVKHPTVNGVVSGKIQTQGNKPQKFIRSKKSDVLFEIKKGFFR